MVKKLLAVSLLALFAAGCMYPGYRRYQRRTNYRPDDSRVAAEEPTRYAPEPERRPYDRRDYGYDRPQPRKKPAEFTLREGFIDLDVDLGLASSIMSVSMGYQPEDSFIDVAVGFGLSFQTIGFVKSRLFLRDENSSPYLFAGYWHAFESEAIEFEDDDEYYSAEYVIEAADVVGVGFGYQWFIQDQTLFHIEIGYHNRLHGGHLEYISGDDPYTAPDLFEDVQRYVPGNSYTFNMGFEFRY